MRKYVQLTIPVPEQPPGRAYPVGEKPPRPELGSVRTCPRCKGIPNKRYKEYGYFVDPNGGRDSSGNLKRCERCNGWGYVPNVGV